MLEKKIVDDVNGQASLVIDQINHEIKMFKEDELDHFKLTITKEIEAYYHAELNELRLETASLISQIQLKTKRELLKVRQELAIQLFNDVKERLETFVASLRYRDFLINKIKQSGHDFNQGYFEVRKKDVALFESILEELKLKATVKEGMISIGGFIYVNEKEQILIDGTIDTSLNEQQNWFQNHSGFIV